MEGEEVGEIIWRGREEGRSSGGETKAYNNFTWRGMEEGRSFRGETKAYNNFIWRGMEGGDHLEWKGGEEIILKRKEEYREFWRVGEEGRSF